MKSNLQLNCYEMEQRIDIYGSSNAYTSLGIARTPFSKSESSILQIIDI